MSSIKAWVKAARLRTLPLSLSGIIVGTALAKNQGFFEIFIFILALLTTIGFQVTSNFANDYGDGVRGTDNEDRIGPARVLQSGLLTKAVLKRGILISSILSLLLAIGLIYLAFWNGAREYFILFFLLGIFCVWAAIRYTMGSQPYGYKGLGDIFVFLFFGLVGVLGSMFLYTKSIHLSALLPAIAIGLLCVGVLNLNNLRDVVSDKKSGKNTLVVKMGFEKGKQYHFILITIAFGCLIVYTLIEGLTLFESFYLIAFVPIFLHLRTVMMTKEPIKLDGELKKLALSTFLLSILFYLAVNNFL